MTKFTVEYEEKIDSGCQSRWESQVETLDNKALAEQHANKINLKAIEVDGYFRRNASVVPFKVYTTKIK